MENVKIPAWLERLRAANGTEDDPNPDPLVNYFNYPQTRSNSSKRRKYESATFGEFDILDAADDDIFDWLSESSKKRDAERHDLFDVTQSLAELERCVDLLHGENCMVKCNLTGTPILHSLSELSRHGNDLLRSILSDKTGAMWANDRDGRGKAFERKDTVFVDCDGFSELYCVAAESKDAADTVFRVTVDKSFCAVLVAVTDDQTVKRVMDIYNRF